MNKKVYQHPTMHIVNIQQTRMLCASGDIVNQIETDVDIIIGGGGGGPVFSTQPEIEDWTK